jgi:DNA-binding NtrC family response regulator
MTNPALELAASSRSAAKPFTILVVEDDPADAAQLIEAIEQADLKALSGDIDIQLRARAEGALRLLTEQPVDLVLTDVVMPSMDGLRLLSQIQKIDQDLPVLIVTRLRDMQTAVQAMKQGAYDYVLKPVNAEDLGMRLHRAIRVSEILRFHSAFKRSAQQYLPGAELVGASPAYHNIMRLVGQAAQSHATVLITGETGTGKGVIARAIHGESQDRDELYQVIDCTTMPEGMIESELFGHVRGAFTGAVADKPGLIELADRGTVFLDEIGDLPLALQGKLLRVLEENEVRRVGGTRVRRIQTRFIAATNQNLEEKIKSGGFRKDLYYRLAVLQIHAPALRDQTEDLPPIARHLCTQLGREIGKPRSRLDPSAMAELTAYSWPGNVRELRNVIERALLLTTRDVITGEEIRALFPAKSPTEFPLGTDPRLPYVTGKNQMVARFTSSYIRAQLALHGGNVTKAAQASGIDRHHFAALMKRYLLPQ